MQLTLDEIDEVLFGTGVLLNGSIYKDKIAGSQILAMLRPGLERLAQEIKRSLAYYDTQFIPTRAEGEAKKILIGGEAVRIANLDKILSVELSLPVSVISLKGDFTSSPSVNPDFLSRSYAALGLGLGLGGEINLLPQEFRTERIEKFQKVSLRWSAFFAFLLLLVPYIFAKAGLGIYQRRLDNTLIHLNALSEVKRIKENSEALQGFAAEVRNLDFPAGSLLKKISGIVPQGMFFNEFNLNCESKTGSIIGFIKDGSASSGAILAEFVGDMNNLKLAVNVKIDSVSKGSDEDPKINNFKISFQLP